MYKTGIQKLSTVVVCVALLLATLPTGAEADVEATRYPADNQSGCEPNEGWYIYINGRCATFDLPIRVYNGRILFPLRETVGKLVGGSSTVRVDWTHDDQAAWVYTPGHLLGFPVGQNWMFWDGATEALDQGAVLVPIEVAWGDFQGFSYIPLRAVVEKLGGKIEWNGAEPNVVKVTIDATAVPTNRELCALHRFSWDDCPAWQFFVSPAYGTFGHEFLRDYVRRGAIADANLTTFVNKIALDKGGAPLRTDPNFAEALTKTVDQLVTDIFIAELAVNVVVLKDWFTRPKPGTPQSTLRTPQRPPSLPHDVYVAGVTTRPKENGWFRIYRNGWSLNTANYQARVSGRPYEGHGTGYIFTEYHHNGRDFDGMKVVNGQRVLVDGKARYSQFLNKDGSFQSWFDGADEIVEEAVRQVEAAASDFAWIEWHFQNADFMQKMTALLNERAPHVFQFIRFIHNP